MRHTILLFIFLVFGQAYAEETIRSYYVTVEAKSNRSVVVTEVIKVNVEGNVFQRGIFRDIPVDLSYDSENYVDHDLDVISVKRNGKSENFSKEYIGIGVRIKIGNADVMLPHGEHTYEIKYELNDMVRMFEDFDELYWNPIGAFWQVPIEYAHITYKFPEGSTILQSSIYSGGQGSTDECEACVVSTSDNHYMIAYNERLYSYTGITAAVAIAKGAINELTPEEIEARKFKQNIPFIGYGSLIIILFVFYFLMWKSIGKDDEDPVIPLFEVPEGISPAGAATLVNEKPPGSSFLLGIIGLAVKKKLKIEDEGKDPILQKLSDDTEGLNGEAEKAYYYLFKWSEKDEIKLSRTNKSILSRAQSNISQWVMKEYYNKYIKSNFWVGGVAILLHIAWIITTGVLSPGNVEGLVYASLVVGFFFFMILMGARYSGRNVTGSVRRTIIWTIILAAIPGAIASLPGSKIGFIFSGMFILIGMHNVFFELMKKPIPEAKELIQKVKGLKKYMETAEKELMEFNTVEENIRHFEELYPYAMAFGIEKKWVKGFEKILESANYRPDWYHGRRSFTPAILGSNLTSSMSSSLSSSMPSSGGSSGSGGGGSTGGGGGGGGGGGW